MQLNGIQLSANLGKTRKRVKLKDTDSKNTEEDQVLLLSDASISGPLIPCLNKLPKNLKVPICNPQLNIYDAEQPMCNVSESDLMPQLSNIQPRERVITPTLQLLLNNKASQKKLDSSVLIENTRQNTEYIQDFGLRMLRGMGYVKKEEG